MNRQTSSKSNLESVLLNKQTLVEKFLSNKKYGENNRYLNYNKFNLDKPKADLDDEIIDPFFHGLDFAEYSNEANLKKHYKKENNSFGRLSPNFDNNVLSSDPFGRLK